MLELLGMPKEIIHIIVGDAHAKPDVPNDRFDWLGRALLTMKLANPNSDIKVIDMGDWEDMPSLSSYDIGKKSYEGRSYRKDLEAAWDARQRTNQAIDEYNERARQNHKRQLNISKYALGGNHFEGRIKRVVENSPLLHGTIGVEDGRHAEFGWDYVPYMEPLLLDGFNYCHSFVSGVMGRPIGGETPGLSLIRKQLTSCVAGHLHLFDMAHRTNPQGKAIWGIFPGCFLDPDQHEVYAGPANHMWKRGILILRGVKDGDFSSFQWIGIDDLKRMFS